MSFREELEEIERRRHQPPPLLFKYVIPERLDVLEHAQIRFSPPLNTNDIFEVRQAFDLLMGPKMQGLLKELATEVDIDGAIREALDDSPVAFLNVDQAKSLFSTFGGGGAENLMRGLLDDFIDHMPAQLNAQNTLDKLLDRVAGNQLLLSLSEKPDSSPMWAHYAANSSGFVLAFDTSSDFFRRGERHEMQGLHKVEYFDGRVSEIVENPYAALISKMSDWSYEHEWRLYAKIDESSDVREVNGASIHLVRFPREAVQRVILGLRASQQIEEDVRSVLESEFSGVPLMRLEANRSTATLTEIPA